jgi:hypothetical protein
VGLTRAKGVVHALCAQQFRSFQLPCHLLREKNTIAVAHIGNVAWWVINLTAIQQRRFYSHALNTFDYQLLHRYENFVLMFSHHIDSGAPYLIIANHRHLEVTKLEGLEIV